MWLVPRGRQFAGGVPIVEHAKIVEAIEGMTVVQLNDLVKALEEKFGVSAAAMAMAAAPAAGAAAAEPGAFFSTLFQSGRRD